MDKLIYEFIKNSKEHKFPKEMDGVDFNINLSFTQNVSIKKKLTDFCADYDSNDLSKYILRDS